MTFLSQTAWARVYTRALLLGFGVITCIAVQTACSVVHAQTSSSKFLAGFAERDISPEIGMEKPGGYGKSYHRTFHDPCKVRAVVFDDGVSRVALVGIDALAIERSTVLAVRAQIHERTGIAPEAILLAASHSHSSGPMCFIMPGDFDHSPAWIQELAYKKSTCADPKYLAIVEKSIVDAVVDADKARVDAKAGIGSGQESQVAFNRRFRMRNGLTVTHPRQVNPDIVEVAGPTDPEVGVIGVWDAKDNFLGCIVNFACHATTNPGGISANYVYYIEKAIRGMFGDEAVVVFLNGASGDVTQVDNLSPFVMRRGEDMARFVGGRVGAEAVKVLISMRPGQLVPVAAKQEVLKIRRRTPDPKRLELSKELVRQDAKTVGAAEWTFAKEIVLLDQVIKKAPVVDVEVQVVQIGPVVVVTDPAEYFCQYGLDIKAGSPFSLTFPVSTANGSVGYVPTEEAFAAGGGGYETRLTSYSNLQISAGRQIRDAGLKLARQLKPGPVPEWPRVGPFKGEVWSYGNASPETK